MEDQLTIVDPLGSPTTGVVAPFKTQLLKWIGNKQRFAHEIASLFPEDMETYIEPFLGSGAVLATLAPRVAVGGDAYAPLAEIWQTLSNDPELLKRWYSLGYEEIMSGERVAAYNRIRERFNEAPSGRGLLILCRTCYGGVIRFRLDGYMSTPCGAHKPISPDSFALRVDAWAERTKGTRFVCGDFEEVMELAGEGDVVYCDPPYATSQAILYGAQRFELSRLLRAIAAAKARGARIALSLDGTKKSGLVRTAFDAPEGLFEREVFINCGRSMLRRFQLGGGTLEDELVADRLLLTY